MSRKPSAVATDGETLATHAKAWYRRGDSATRGVSTTSPSEDSGVIDLVAISGTAAQRADLSQFAEIRQHCMAALRNGDATVRYTEAWYGRKGIALLDRASRALTRGDHGAALAAAYLLGRHIQDWTVKDLTEADFDHGRDDRAHRRRAQATAAEGRRDRRAQQLPAEHAEWDKVNAGLSGPRTERARTIFKRRIMALGKSGDSAPPWLTERAIYDHLSIVEKVASRK